MEVSVEGDEIDDALLKSRIQEAWNVFKDLLDVEGILSFDTGAISITDSGPDVAQATDGTNVQARDGNNLATVIGATAGTLALLLLLLLLVRRNNNEEEVSHLKLEEDDGDETFVKEFDGSSGKSSPYRFNRTAHVVGESDSIFSGWTGYSPDGRGGSFDADGYDRDGYDRDGYDRDGYDREGYDRNGYDRDGYDRNGYRRGHGTDGGLYGAGAPGKLSSAHGDVHYCSSATCEICERRRQQGVCIVVTGSPPRQTIPTDASREYVSNDTVDL